MRKPLSNLVYRDIIAHLKRIISAIEHFAKEKNIHLFLYMRIDRLVMNYDEVKFQFLVQKLLTHAIQYTEFNGRFILHVNATLEGENDVLKFTFSNDENDQHQFEFAFASYDLNLKNKHTDEGDSPISIKRPYSVRNQIYGTSDRWNEFVVAESKTSYQPTPDHDTTSDSNLHQSSERTLDKTSETFEVNEINPIESDYDTSTKNLPILLIIAVDLKLVISIKKMLERQYHFEHASNSQEGINKALEIVPDIILIDVMVPDLEVSDICPNLKNEEKTIHIPIVLFTTKSNSKIRQTVWRVGADAYVLIPFSEEECINHMQQTLELQKKIKKKHEDHDLQSSSMAGKRQSYQPKSKFLKLASEHVQEHINDSAFGNAQLAQKMTLSESQLNRKIKKLTGLTLSLFIRQIRLEQAKVLLITEDKTISEIAYEVGFNDPSYFSRTFSKTFGLSPSQFRIKSIR